MPTDLMLIAHTLNVIKNIIELKSEVIVTSHDRAGYLNNFLFINNNCVVSYAPSYKICNYLLIILKVRNMKL